MDAFYTYLKQEDWGGGICLCLWVQGRGTLRARTSTINVQKLQTCATCAPFTNEEHVDLLYYEFKISIA